MRERLHLRSTLCSLRSPSLLLSLPDRLRAAQGADEPPPPLRSALIAQPAVVRIVVQGVSSPPGQITALLFASDEGLPAKEAQAAQRVSVPASVGAVTLHCERVPAGTYAVTVHHDASGNGKLDSHWIASPRSRSRSRTRPRAAWDRPSSKMPSLSSRPKTRI
jgi:hypothetical protein